MADLREQLRRAVSVFKDAGAGWIEHRAPRMGAALSYYTIFSMGPLIVIAIALAGLIFGRDAAQNRLFEQLKDYIGSDAAAMVQEAVRGASHPNASLMATVIGGATLLVGATYPSGIGRLV
jgi:membrane protein